MDPGLAGLDLPLLAAILLWLAGRLSFQVLSHVTACYSGLCLTEKCREGIRQLAVCHAAIKAHPGVLRNGSRGFCLPVTRLLEQIISSPFRLRCQLLRKTVRKEGFRGRQQLLSQNGGVGKLRRDAIKPGSSASVLAFHGPARIQQGEDRRQQKPGEVAQDVTRNFVLVTA